MSNLQLFFILFTISNSISYLNTQYVGTLQGNGAAKVALRRSFELKCEYTGSDEDGGFVDWHKVVNGQDVSVGVDKPGHYVVKHNPRDSTLQIKIFVQADAEVTSWYVLTKKVGYEKPTQCRFGPIALTPSPQGIEDNKGLVLNLAHESIRRTEDQLLNLKCLIEPDVKPRQDTKWEYSKDGETFSELPDGINNMNDVQLEIGSVKKNHRGYYRCTLNDVSFTVLLRVKDRLAALWPFIGIVAIVLVLVIIILIFEKRQKSNKKSSTTDDDDQDHASDPLVRTTIRPSDNDVKNRTVKA